MSDHPVTWLMLGHKAGDNGQLKALAGALGWPVIEKHLVYRKTELLTNLFAGPTLAGLVPEKSSPLEPPWPDLIISAGRRNEPLVRWIRQQAGPDRVRLVHVGRPWALHECFDLIITTPQYRLPDKPNILHNEAPLHRVDAERLVEARGQWETRLEHLPEPRTAVIMGGNAGPYDMDRENGELLGWHANRLARETGGSLMVTSSARTPREAVDALERMVDVPAVIYRWSPDATDNPYMGFLALADRIIVTCDSMSMLAEACETGKPVMIFDLLRGPGSHRPAMPDDGSVRPRTPIERLRQFSLRPFFYKLGMTIGPRRLTRDVSIIHRRQVEAGRARWLGSDEPEPRTAVTPIADLERAADAVRALFNDPPPPRPVMPSSVLPEWLQRFVQG
ncbi:MAG: mitochondrial fission ELM1 family protein [Geminicoccaceae bacterium]|nr:mitochondrial fission ELM1 family protein [Geminicoccaceae bacterium]